MPAVNRPHRTLVGPPEGKASPREAESAVQELRIAKASPSMASGEKFLLSSCFLPRAASCWSSGATLSRRVPGAMVSSVGQWYTETAVRCETDGKGHRDASMAIVETDTCS